MSNNTGTPFPGPGLQNSALKYSKSKYNAALWIVM